MTLQVPLAPYLLWAKTRQPAPIDLAGSNLLHCSLDDLPGARDALELWVANDRGYAPLVEQIAAHYRVDSTRVATAAGCSGANFLAIAALAGAGDEVLIERPTYDPLVGACLLMGATVRRFDRRFEDGYAIDVEAVRAALTPRTRLIVVTTPHNPSGISAGTSALEPLGRLAAEVGIHVLVDEVYLDAARMISGEAQLPSAAQLDGPFISTSSLTKSYGLAGLRCGWAIAPPAIAERIRRTRDVVDNIGVPPADRLSALAFAHLPSLAQRAQSLLSTNIAAARQFFHAHRQLELAGPPSSPICFPRLRGVDDAEAFVERLLVNEGVAVAPGRFFDAPAHFRISLGGRPDIVSNGLARLGEALVA